MLCSKLQMSSKLSIHRVDEGVAQASAILQVQNWPVA